MTNPNDLIRRGDALAAIQEYAVQQVGAFQQPTLKGAADTINSIPAVQPTVKPELLATTNDVAALVDVIRVQTGLIRHGCGGAQHRLNICCDRIDAALASLKGGAA